MVLDCCCSGDSSDEGKNVSVLASLLDTVNKYICSEVAEVKGDRKCFLTKTKYAPYRYRNF